MLRPQWTSFCCTPEGPFEMQWTSASCRQFGAASSKGHGALFYVQPHAGSGFNGLQQCFPLPYGPGCDFNLKSKPCKTHLILWMRDKMKLGRGALGLQLRKNRGLCTSLCTSLCRPSVVLHTATSQLFSPLLQKAEHRQRKQQTAEFEVVHCWVCCVQCVMDQRAGVACKAHRHVAQQRSMKAEPYSPPPYILVATHGHNRA